MSNLTKLFNYKGNNVTFKDEAGILYANAKRTAKSIGKTTKDWLRTSQCQEFLSELIQTCNISIEKQRDNMPLAQIGEAGLFHICMGDKIEEARRVIARRNFTAQEQQINNSFYIVTRIR